MVISLKFKKDIIEQRNETFCLNEGQRDGCFRGNKPFGLNTGMGKKRPDCFFRTAKKSVSLSGRISRIAIFMTLSRHGPALKVRGPMP